jgi:ribonuclease P protein component
VKRSFRLTRSTDFERVRRFGKSHAHPLIVLVASSNQLSTSRIGIIAGRRLGNAVCRNHVKRVIRALLQSYLERIQPGWDILLIARTPVIQANFHQLQVAIDSLLMRASLIRENDGN